MVVLSFVINSAGKQSGRLFLSGEPFAAAPFADAGKPVCAVKCPPGLRHCSVFRRAGRYARTSSIGDLTGSNKRRPHCGWPGRSCDIARQQVEAALRPVAGGSGHCPPTSLYRRPARLRPMVGQVVFCCAAASGSRTADYRSSSSASGYSMKPAGSGAGRGQSEVIR